MVLPMDESVPNALEKTFPYPYMHYPPQLLWVIFPQIVPLDQAILICNRIWPTKCKFFHIICYMLKDKETAPCLLFPEVCGWGSGDMREEHTLQDSVSLHIPRRGHLRLKSCEVYRWPHVDEKSLWNEDKLLWCPHVNWIGSTARGRAMSKIRLPQHNADLYGRLHFPMMHPLNGS